MRSMKKWFVLLICTALLACLALSGAAAEGWEYRYDYSTGIYEKYYLDSNGNRATGFRTIDGYKYYFDSNGLLQTGWKTIDGNKYYFNEYAYTGFASVYNQAASDYDYYYFDSEGRMQTGWIRNDGHLYYYGADGKRAGAGWLTLDSGKYYITGYGYAATGSYVVWRNNNTEYDYYYFDASGKMQTGWITDDGKKYYYGSDGKRVTGWLKLGNDRYYLDPAAYTGSFWLAENSKTDYYYADENGKIQTGWITLEEQDYSGNKVKRKYYYGSDGKRLTGLQKIDGDTYYLNSAVSYGLCSVQNPATGKWDYYYFDPETGKMQTGFIKVEQPDYSGGTVTRTYYFGTDGKRHEDGWLKLGDDYYYLTPELRTGLVSVYDKTEEKSYYYYFDADGKMQTGLQKVNDKLYYFGTDGKAASGWQKVGSDWYCFSKYGNTAYTGVNYIDDGYYCFNDDGVMQTGWNDAGESRGWRLFSDSGKMVESFAGMSSVTIPAKVSQLKSSAFTGIGRDFVIYCEPGSYAESFAIRNGFQYSNGRKSVVGYQISSVDQKVKWIVDNYTTADMSDLEKVRALHDWLIHNAHYDSTYTVHAASGVLLNGSGVCESYAKAYILLLNQAGIENKYVSGGNHAWNLVKLGDNWYHVDCTWDDPTSLSTDDPVVSGYEGYSYFLVSDATMRKDHTWTSSVQATEDMNWRGEPGWQQTGGVWYYYDADGFLTTGHARIDGVLYGFTGDGRLMTSGWQNVGGVYYYAAADGSLKENEWVSDGGWYYLGQDGVMATGWQEIGGEWYFFAETGAMATGWIFDGSDWYFLGAGGTVSTGWVQDGGSWYYMSSGGKMQTGWQEIGGTWYYFSDGGAMKTGWTEIGGAWYYFSGSGAMQTGWVQDGGSWYYLSSGGKMQTGWQEIGGSWYYLKSDGKMASGWLQLGGTWYYLAGGKMVTGWQEIGGQWEMFSDSGAWLYSWQGN